MKIKNNISTTNIKNFLSCKDAKKYAINNIIYISYQHQSRCQLRFSWPFWKSKSKSYSKKGTKFAEDDTDAGLSLNTHQRDHNPNLLQFEKSTPRRQSDCLSQDSLYLKDLLASSRPQPCKIRSYPVSPRKSIQENIGYLSDQNSHKTHNSPYIKQTDAVHQNPPNLKPRATLGSSEPFPFQVPSDPVPRQSLFYELRYGDRSSVLGLQENPKDIAEKPIEDYEIPTSSTFKDDHYPYNYENSVNFDSENENTGRKTIVRIRPLSTTSRPQRQSVRAMPLRAEEVLSSVTPSKRVHQVPFKSNLQQAPILMTNDGKILQPVKEDKLRRNSLRLETEAPTMRVSVVKPVHEEYLEYGEHVPVIPMRESLRKSLVRQSLASRHSKVESPRRASYRIEKDVEPVNISGEEDVSIDVVQVMPSRKSEQMYLVQQPIEKEETHGHKCSTVMHDQTEQETQHFPFAQTRNEPIVYAVSNVPTRGTRKSVLQQSVKSLTSRNKRDEPTMYKKNIRYSMDTDIFAAEPRRRSVAPSSPGYVNMEKGQPMLVSEFLNPITSLFISDLKDPVPKDPLRKPREANVWVRPRSSNGQRNSVSKPPSKPVRVQQVYQVPPPPSPKAKVVHRRISRKSYYKEESSSSDESIVVYRKKSKSSAPRRSYYRTAVYAAQIPSSTLPHHEVDKVNADSINDEIKSSDFQETSSSKHICGLRLGPSEQSFLKQEEDTRPKYRVRMVSSAQQTDIDDDLDLICYPSESILKDSAIPSESGSKLRWRIIIKRGDEN